MLGYTAFSMTRYRVGACVAAGALLGLVAAYAGTGPDEARRREVLIEALAEARAEADGLRARLEALEFGRYDAAWTPDTAGASLDSAALASLRVLDVNRDLGMVILNAGHREGLRPGMRFALMQDGRTTAHVRVADVRLAVSGAVIEREELRRAVSTADRPVLLREVW